MKFKDKFVLDDHFVNRNVWVSSWALSIALLGDALLYVVLPVHADAFGLSMAAVGVLLAINRIIRTFTYGFIVGLGTALGTKRLALIASSVAAISTLGYGITDGVLILSLSRVAWGLSYAGLLIVTLHYASLNISKTGTRIGISRSIEQVGPLLVMVVGTWAASWVGPQKIFIYIGFVSALAVLLAYFLIELDEAEKPPKKTFKNFSIPRPKPIDSLIFWMGFGIDGVFTVTIALMWVKYSSPEVAIIIGGLILSIRRVGEMFIAPMSGNISDKFGETSPLFAMLFLCGSGFFLVGTGHLIIGSVALVICRGALGTLFPAAASKLYQNDRMTALTRNQTWRDIGAAAGPLLTGVLLGFISAEMIHLLMLSFFALTSCWFFASGDCKRLSQLHLPD